MAEETKQEVEKSFDKSKPESTGDTIQFDFGFWNLAPSKEGVFVVIKLPDFSYFGFELIGLKFHWDQILVLPKYVDNI